MKKLDKIIYGSGRLGSSILLQLVGLLSFYLYFEIFRLDPFLNGVANAIAKLVIAFSGFYMGYISDKTKSRWGRRKPYILIGAPALAFTFIMIFIPHVFNLNITKFFGFSIGNELALFIYLLIFLSSFNFFYGFLTTPFQSWLPELAEEKERIAVSVYENFFNVVAGGVSFVFFFFFPLLFSGKGMAIVPFIVLTFAVIEVGCYILPFVRLLEDPKRFIAQPNLKTELRVVWKNKNYMRWMIVQGFFSIAFTIIINSALGFVQNILMFSTIEYIVAAALLIIITIIFWKIWSTTSIKKSKHWTLSRSLIIFTIAIPFSILGVLHIEIFGYIYVALISAGISSWYLFPYVIIADMAEDDELRTGEKRAGMYTGFNSIPLNIFQAIAMLVSGIIFSIFPYLPPNLTESKIRTLIILNNMISLPQQGQSLIVISYLMGILSLDFPNPISSGYLWFGPICVIFMVVGLIIFKKVKIDFKLEERKKKT